MLMFTFSICDWKYSFWVTLVQTIATLSLNLVPTVIHKTFETNSSIDNFFFFFRIVTFVVKGKFSKTSKSFKILWKWLQTGSNKENFMVMFTFFVFYRKYPFWTNLVQQIKIVSLSWKFIPRLTSIFIIQ